MKMPVHVHSRRAAEILGRPESTLRYWRTMGIGPAWLKPEGRVLYDEADLLEYIQRGRRNPSVRAHMEEHDGSL